MHLSVSRNYDAAHRKQRAEFLETYVVSGKVTLSFECDPSLFKYESCLFAYGQ